MNLYCQGFIVIWIILHQGRVIFSASLGSESQDTNLDDITDSQAGRRYGHIHQTNHRENFENTKYRTRIPYERRNRPIYTSKTYFGRNHEQPIKYFSNNDGKRISSVRVNTGRPLTRFGKYLHRKIDTDSYRNHHINGHRIEGIPDRNTAYGATDEYGQKPGYETKDHHNRHGYGSMNMHGQGYGSRTQNPGYGSNGEYGTKEQGSNHGYDKNAYDGNPNYAQDVDGSHLRDESNAEEGKDFRDIFGYDREPGYATNIEHGLHPEHNSNSEYGFDPELYAHFKVNQNQRDNVNSEYVSTPNHRIPYLGYSQTPKLPENTRYDGNSNFHDLKQEYEIDERKRGIENLNIHNGKKNVHIDDHTKILNRYNQLLSEKTLHSTHKNAITITTTASNTDFILDESLKQDELLKDFNEEKFRNIMPSGDEFKGSIELSEMEGSGNVENNPDDKTSSNLEEANKSGRILDIFSRFNDSTQCTTPKNESGHCRGLTECPIIEQMENFSSFLQYMCFQRGRLVGICCPDNPVIEITDTPGEKSSEKVKLEQPLEGCGLSTNTRIVGGTMSIPHEFSWMVALLRRNRFYCGGVIINNWYILTAAHCVLGIKVSDLKVRLGEFDFNQRNDVQHDIPITEIKRHALFVTATFQHDIALLKLKRKIEYTKFIGSICLPNKDEDFTKRSATVAGWGTVSFGGAASPILRKVTVPVWDNKECDRTYVFERINESFMCAGSPANGEDACQGDSGGPLMAMNDENRWEVIGIVSWGRRCGDPTFPGVYTRVTSYLDWIAENAQ